MARTTVLQQHARHLTLTADQFSAELNIALSSRLQALRAAAAMLKTEVGEASPRAQRAVLDDLQSAYRELEWIGLADAHGTMLATSPGLLEAGSAAAPAWFAQGLKRPWIGDLHAPGRLDESRLPAGQPGRSLALAVAVQGLHGRAVGVLGAHLSWAWIRHYARGLHDTLHLESGVEAMVVDGGNRILFGPAALESKVWRSTPVAGASLVDAARAQEAHATASAFERLEDGRIVLVSRIDPPMDSALHTLGWRAQLVEPSERAYQRADALRLHILLSALALGAAGALAGVLIALRLTRRLVRLTRSVEAVGGGKAQHLELPSGIDEVARVGAAFANVLGALQRERSELRTLSAELEQRVAARTREVERLAEETRYAAVVRERLKIARDLHDTLAHSMMAMLSEVRFLRKLQVHDPDALSDELAQAEQVAHQGLKEARAAISQMRFNAVRDVGLGAALADAIQLFTERTGLVVDYVAEPGVSSFADERAETLFRIAEEALRNAERHARASRITVALRNGDDEHLQLSIADDGVGFDPHAGHPGHYGLVGLREQAQLIGAELNIESEPGRGTTLRISLLVTGRQKNATA